MVKKIWSYVFKIDQLFFFFLFIRIELTPSVSILSPTLSQTTPKIVSLLVNFLTVDTTHFGVPLYTNNTSAPIKVSKIMPTNASLIIQSSTINSTNAASHQSLTNTSNSANINNNNSSSSKTPASLLQQTLHNQHNINSSSSNLNAKSQLLNTQQVNNNNNSNKTNTHEQNAKNALCNWLTTCFQAEPDSELTKTQLYPYYQQIAKLNTWLVFIFKYANLF
jgi:hypothetical protein